MNVDPQGAQRAFDQILHAALRIGHRGGLVNAQRFLEQINRLIARAVERLDKRMCCNFAVEPKVGVDDRKFSSSQRTDRE